MYTKVQLLCSICKIEKTLENCSLYNKGKGGFASYCKKCTSTRKKKLYQKHKTRIKQKASQHRLQHLNEIREYQKEHYVRNSEAVRKKSKMYYHANISEIREKNRKLEKHKREDVKLYQKNYRREKKESLSEKNKAYKQKNSEIISLKTRAYCEENKAAIALKQKAYQQKNKEAIALKQKAYQQKNKEAIALKQKAYQQKNKESIACYKKAYVRKNRETLALKQRMRYSTDVLFKIKVTLRNRLLQALKGNLKSSATLKLLGCSLERFKSHLESQFKPGMTWDNHGKYGWHIDHVRPCASFDLSYPEQQGQCFHFTNLQPLWAKDNLEKRAKWDGELNA